MKLSQEEKRKLRYFLEQWEQEEKISSEQRQLLEKDLRDSAEDGYAFDWKNLSFLSFFFAVICVMLASSLVLVDDWLEKMLDYLFDVPDWIKSLLLFGFSFALYLLAVKQRRRHPKRVFSNEAFFLFGAVGVAFGMTYLGFSFDMYDGYFPVLILSASVIYGLLGLALHSSINWYLALAGLALWFGTETAYRSDWGDYFLGMNYPMRYVLFGLILLGLYRLFRHLGMQKKFLQSTYTIGLLAIFFSFWLLSIFGNYASLNAWSEVSQFRFLYWAVALAIVSAGAIWYGLKRQDKIARELGVIFLLLNIYTRYFEFFWDSLDKVVFFSIMALSFWLIGRKAETIWSLADRL